MRGNLTVSLLPKQVGDLTIMESAKLGAGHTHLRKIIPCRPCQLGNDCGLSFENALLSPC